MIPEDGTELGITEGTKVGAVRSRRKKENRNLSKKRKRHINNNTLVKHWFPLSFYCFVLQYIHLRLKIQAQLRIAEAS